MEQNREETLKKSWYDKVYKFFLVIPLILTILSVIYLGFFFSKNHDFMYKDVSLSGGTTITLTGNINTENLEAELKKVLKK